VGARTGLGYSFGEGGRHERVLTDSQTQQYGATDNTNHLLKALLCEMRESNRISRITADASRNSAKSLGGTGRGVL